MFIGEDEVSLVTMRSEHTRDGHDPEVFVDPVILNK